MIVPTLGTLLTALTARFLGSESYGRLATLSTYAGWFAVISSYPTMSLLAKFVAEGKHREHPYERECATALALAVLQGVLAVLFAVALLPVGLAYYQVGELWLAGLLLCSSFVLAPPLNFSLLLLQATGRLRLWSVLYAALYVVQIASVAAAALLVRPFTIEAYAAALTLAGLVNAVAGLVIASRIVPLKDLFRPDLSVVKDQLREGFGGYVASMFNVLASLLVSTLIIKKVGRTELGHYQLILTIGGWVNGTVGAVTIPALSQWSSLIARGRLKTLRRGLRIRQLATGSIETLVGVAALAFAPQILGLMYGESYRQSAALLRLAVGYWVLVGFGTWYWIYFTALGRPGLVMWPNVAYGCIVMLVSGVLLQFTGIGLPGAIAAVVGGHAGWLVCYEVLFRSTMRRAMTRAAPASIA